MARAGAKGAITAEPLDFTGWPEPGWERLVRFAREYVVTPKGVGAGEPFVLRPWQVEIVKGLFPVQGRPRTGLVSLPRGNGKTTLAATIALYDLFASGTVSPQVMVVAGTEQVARHTLKIAARMIELSPMLAERAHLLQASIKVPPHRRGVGDGGVDRGGAAGLRPVTADRGRVAHGHARRLGGGYVRCR